MDKSNNFEFKSNIPEDVLELTKEICPYKPVCNDVCNPLPDCGAMLYAWRTINAGYVKVVRCKECVWWEPYTFGSSIGRCGNPYKGLEGGYIDDTDYCSYAKMKEADNE